MDPIENIMGGFGRYHVYLYLIMSISQTYPAFQQIGIVFLAPKVPYTCDGVKNACPCPNPKFDRSVFPNTIIMQWNLICEKKMLVSFTQTMFQLGTLTGSVVFGMAADRYGRKKPMLFAVLCQIIFGILVAYVPSYWAFTFIRFLIGMTVGGVMVVGFVILMEFVGTKYREATSAMVQFPFNMGHMLLPLIAYYFREYKQLLLAVSIPSLLMLPYFVLLPETPRWLLAAKKTEKAIKIIEKVTKMNKRDTANLKSKVEAFQAVLEANKLKRGTILDLFRTPNIRKNIICVSLDWLACSYCFYGVSQFVGQLGGSIFINVFISAAVTTCGTLFSVPWMKMSGRRTIIIVNCYICAACLILLAFLPEGLVSVILASFGVVCSFIMFIVVYLYSAEMFPTVVRNAAIGFSSMIARIGSMVAPFVIDLGDISRMLPPLVFALVPLISGTTTFLLPETKGCPLLTTVEEGERFGKKQQHTTET